jgi:2,4-dienoyl-CoA reductase-like NADH-dependent reductase (Old Yellow Enzyme family)
LCAIIIFSIIHFYVMASLLFTPIALRNLTLSNRIVVAPMCQYSADDGSATDWHMMHLPNLAVSGAGLLMIEATGVEAIGRISPGCLGLYSDANETALARVLKACRTYSNTPIGIQLAHAGRKGSVHTPWHRGALSLQANEGAWQTMAPSAVPMAEGWHTPHAMDRADMDRVKAAFLSAAHRADRLGIDLAELHAAHGYLLNEFLSPLSNLREDEYGGSLENRMRFPLEVAVALRAAWRDKPLGARISGSDWQAGGTTPDEAVRFAAELKKLDYDYVCVTSGGISAKAKIAVDLNYQVPFAAQVKKQVGIATRAVGMIVTPQQAEQIIATGQADMVAIARGFIDNPRWVWHAAEVLGAQVAYPPQYERGQSKYWPGAKILRQGATVETS